MKPRLYLDVDGVLNTTCTDHEFMVLGGEHCYVVPGIKVRIDALAEAFEMWWATAWLGSARTAWPVILGESCRNWPWLDYRDYKLTEIITQTPTGQPWAWVDDDVDWELRQLGWDAKRMLRDDTLIVKPEHNVGLTDEHVEELLAFADA